MKSSAKIIEVLLDNVPTFVQEIIIKAIWPRGFIKGEMFNNIINFLVIGRDLQGAEVGMVDEEGIKIKKHSFKFRCP